MNKDCLDFLNLRVKPAVVGTREAAWILGIRDDWVPILVGAGLLKVAGGHQSGCQFFFASATLMELASDEEWVHKAVAHVRRTFQRKNRAAKQYRDMSEAESEVLAGGSHG